MQYRYIKLTINIFDMKKVYETLDMHVVKIDSSGRIAMSALTNIGGRGEGFSALDADGGNLDTIDEEEEFGW